MTKQEIIEAIKAHAIQNYNRGGWDFVVETYEDAEIAEEIEDGDTFETAVKRFEDFLKVLDDHRREQWAIARYEIEHGS